MSGWRSSRHHWVGTPLQVVTLCRAVSSSQVRGSHGPGGGKTSVVGKAAPVSRTAIMPETWNIGLATMVQPRAGPGAGPGATAAAMAAASRLTIAKLMMFRCDSVAPLGRPVVPLVNRMTAAESSVTPAGAGVLPVNSRASRCSSPVSRTGTPAGTEPSARRASRRSSPAMSSGEVSPMPYSSSGVLHHPFRLVTIAPRVTTAHIRIAYSAWLAATMATRSPAVTP